MARIVHSPEAIEDLARLWVFLEQAAPDQASVAIENLIGAIDVLVSHPLVGRRVAGEARELVISRGTTGYVALYRFEPAREVIRILRIRHQRETGFSD